MAFAALFGVGHNDSAITFFKGDAWLPSNDSGSVVRVNGATGKPDFEMRFKSANGADLQVIQGPDGVFVLNRDTGEVTKLDDAQLQLGGTIKADPADNPAFLIGGGKGFLVSQRTGRVQQVDPSSATLDPVGGAVELKHPISNAVVDPRGRLTAAISETGELAFVADGKADAPVRVADPNDELRVSLVDDQLFAIDHTKATVAPVDPDTGVQTVYTIDVPRDGTLLVTEKMTGGRLWVLHMQTARLLGIDVGTGRSTTIDLDEVKGHELGAPLPNGVFVYVPDFQLGALLKIDPETGKIVDRARVVDSTDPNRELANGRPFTAFVKDDRVWGNDPRGQVAVVIDRAGNAQQIEKYREGLPNSDDLAPLPDALPATTVPSTPRSTPTTSPKRNDPNPNPGGPTTTSPRDPADPADPADPGGPTPPEPGDPADGGRQKRELPKVPDPADANQKSTTGAGGTPGAPTVPNVPGQPVPPPPAANVPGAPTGVQATAGDASATVTWSAAADNGSPITTYVIRDAANNVNQSVAASGPAGQATLTGLTNGTTYTFAVSARNGIGDGPAATAAPVTPTASAPGAPSNVTFGYMQASSDRTDYWPQVQWGAPTQNAQLVNRYNVLCAAPGASVAIPEVVPAGSGGPYNFTFADLPLGVGVTCWVEAVDGAGVAGPRVAMAAGTVLTPWGSPDPATNTGVTMNGDDALLRWEPDFDGGRPIVSYRVHVERFDGSLWATYANTVVNDPAARTLNLADIPFGDYRFTVAITNRDAASGDTATSLTPITQDITMWTFSPMPTTTTPLSGFSARPAQRPSVDRSPASSVDHLVTELVALFLEVSAS